MRGRFLPPILLVTVLVGAVVAAGPGVAVAQNPIPPGTFLTLVPHSAVGGGYITRLFITNLTANPNALTINRISQSGTLVSSTPTTLQPAATLMIVDSETLRTGPLTVEWFALGSEMPIAASVLFDFEGASVGLDSNIRQAVGALASPALNVFTAPVRFDSSVGATIGLALANANSTGTEITLRLIDQNGTIVATDSLILLGFRQTAFVVSDRPAFQSIVTAPGGFLGSLAVTVNDPAKPVSALVVGAVQTELFTLPVTSGVASLPVQVTVFMDDFFFTSRVITIARGSTVTWRNQGEFPHSATADNGSFDTGIFNPGGQRSVTFNTAGTFPYHCVLHGAPGGVGMSGTVVVTE